MSEKKKLSIGRELTDNELMEMTGGASFYIPCQKNYAPSISSVVKYAIPDLENVALYGIPVDPIIKPLYGVEPEIKPLYGIDIGK